MKTRSLVDFGALVTAAGGKTAVLALTLLFTIAASANAADQDGARAGRHVQQAHKAVPGEPGRHVRRYKIDDDVSRRQFGNPLHTSRVIVTLTPGAKLPSEFKRFVRGKNLNLIDGAALELPNGLIRRLAAMPQTVQIHDDRPIEPQNYRTSVTVGAAAARRATGLMGDGIGIAIIDSGVTSWHDDLTRGSVSKRYPYGDQRIAKFVDFVHYRTQPYDDNGHGTHIAGIVAGNGYDSRGEKMGIAPNASLVSLKVLDENGQGTISNIIAALDWVVLNHATYNIRVVNLSAGAQVHESYWTDPLTLAAKRVTDLGITVVTAAGNQGTNAAGALQYGGIVAPANAPWVLTVGASSTEGTLTRSDDVMAGYSSAGPTPGDYLAKPDLVAPGTGTVSLAAQGSTLMAAKPASLIGGTPPAGVMPYLSLSGTSMAAPVVTGTVALMLQADPSLTPNLIKAILQYTAERYASYNSLRQGAGFLNTLGAVRLSQFYSSNRVGARMPIQRVWSRNIVWGNHRLAGGYLNPKGSAWTTGVVWGAATAANGEDNIVWGTMCADCDNIVWGTADADNIVWGTSDAENIVWGTSGDADNIVWGTSAPDNIVWGTASDENIVWGTDCGGADCENIVWGTTDADNIVWGTASGEDNIVWGTNGADNIVWGTSAADNIVWGTSAEDNIVWGTAVNPELQIQFPDVVDEPVPDPAIEFGEIVF
jgi:subtilisin family serine protease